MLQSLLTEATHLRKKGRDGNTSILIASLIDDIAAKVP